MKLILPILVLAFVSHVLAVEAPLSLEEATKIAKKRITNDGLPVDHMVIHLVDSPQLKSKCYVIWFDPQIPDPSSKKEGNFIGFHIEMDGTIKRTVITQTVERVQTKRPDPLTTPISLRRLSSSKLLDEPFTLQLSARKLRSEVAD